MLLRRRCVATLHTNVQQAVVDHGVHVHAALLQLVEHVHGPLKVAFLTTGLDHGHVLRHIPGGLLKETLRPATYVALGTDAVVVLEEVPALADSALGGPAVIYVPADLLPSLLAEHLYLGTG